MPPSLSPEQQEIIDLYAGDLTLATFFAIIEGERQPEDLSDSELLDFLQLTNLLYRSGEPVISDDEYDFSFLNELRRRHPDHPFLGTVEPEPVTKTVELPERMLSTDKAYNFSTIQRWINRIEKAAHESQKNFSELQFRVTPKLDGFAAYDDGTRLYTRGDGRRGTDITRAMERGLQVAEGGLRGLGPGEIVVNREWFTLKLAGTFENSRNVQAALIKEKELDPLAEETLREGKAVFYPFSLLPDWRGTWAELSADFNAIVEHTWHLLEYNTDGVVLEIVDEEIKKSMGDTRHHHRWQIAWKQNTETVEVRLLAVVPQTSRSGRVNPVAEFPPTRLRGALIRRATAHHYAMVRDLKIGPGALIRLSRSGEVIPKIEEVLEPGEVQIPTNCPSCNGKLIWEGDWLVCTNQLHCPAQIVNSMEHFFKTLGNIDGFGPSALHKIYNGGVRTLGEIYALSEGEFQKFGFGPKQAENIVAQLQRSLREPIEDWRFLAAFGVRRMGAGNCEKLLAAFPLEDIFSLKIEQIKEIKGFSEKIGEELVDGLAAIRVEFDQLRALGFTLIPTPLTAGNEAEKDAVASPVAGKTIVFTGSMVQGKRDDMKKQAKALGARVGSSVSGSTDFLVCGAKVGAAKLSRAEQLGVQIISEEEYLSMIG
jgi:DNA ligase (NAD+)